MPLKKSIKWWSLWKSSANLISHLKYIGTQTLPDTLLSDEWFQFDQGGVDIGAIRYVRACPPDSIYHHLQCSPKKIFLLPVGHHLSPSVMWRRYMLCSVFIEVSPHVSLWSRVSNLARLEKQAPLLSARLLAVPLVKDPFFNLWQCISPLPMACYADEIYICPLAFAIVMKDIDGSECESMPQLDIQMSCHICPLFLAPGQT